MSEVAQIALQKVQQIQDMNDFDQVFSSISQTMSEESSETMFAFSLGLFEIAKSGNRKIQAIGFYWCGRSYVKTSKTREALESFYAAFDISTEIEYFSYAIGMLVEIGTIYQDLGDYEDALRTFEEALELSIVHQRNAGRIVCLANLSDTQRFLGHYQRATEYAKEALQIARDLGWTRHEANALICLSEALIAIGKEQLDIKKFHEALSHFNQAHDFLLKANNDHGLYKLYLCRSKALCELEQYDEAIAAAEKALEYAKHFGALEIQGICELQFGAIFIAQRQFEAALKHLDAAKKFFEVNTAKKFLSDVHKAYYQVFRGRSEFEAALEHFELFYKFESLVRTENVERRSQAIALKIERENVRREALWYQQRSEELSALNEQLQAQTVQLDQQAKEDSLTGTANRRTLEDFSRQAFLEAVEGRLKLCFVLLDIDHFKLVNDRFLHATGDQVIRRIAAILQEQCRGHDLVARYGGEEFALVLPGLSGVAAYRFCERIREIIETEDWSVIHTDLRVTISLGWCDDTSLGSHEKMLDAADRALYGAKNAGRNCTRPRVQGA